MATYGITAKSIMQSCLGNDPTRIKSYETRFIGHVYPGESLKINIWKEADKLLFLVETVERNTKAVSGMLTIRETAKL